MTVSMQIANAVLSHGGACTAEKTEAARLMETPERARLHVLQSAGLAYVPFSETSLLDHSEGIFDVWGARFKSGVMVLEDKPAGAHQHENPITRFEECWKAKFEDGWAVRNAGFMGRFFVWIDFPRVFMNISMAEFSGLCCPPGFVRAAFGSSLQTLMEDFAKCSADMSELEGVSFYRDISTHYQEQWALKSDLFRDR